MKKIFTILSAALLCASASNAATWSVIGGFNGWGADEDMTQKSENVYEITMPSLSGEFKFRCDHSWDVNLGADYVKDLTGNATVPVENSGANFSFETEVTNVTLTLDVANKTLTISGLPNDMVVPEPPKIEESGLYLIGEPAGQWKPSVGIGMTETAPGVFSWEGELKENQYLSFVTELDSNNDWNVLNSHRYGPESDGTELSPNTALGLVYPKDGAWKVVVTDNYTVVVDTKAMTVKALNSVGVNCLEAVGNDAVYFNMQGMRVANPENGMYIRISNNKSEKVIVK